MKDITTKLQKTEVGNVEITFTIPTDLVLKTKDKVVEELAKDITLSGFRKGMAPLVQVEKSLNQETLYQHILNKLLPKAFADAVEELKVKPAIYPKFEVIKIGQGSDWEIKAISCELPKIDLGNYKQSLASYIKKEMKSKTEDELLQELPQIIKMDIPKLLINEEVNQRLSQLLSRIEKLGLDLEGYLKSVGKDANTLRSDYQKQASSAISLEVILNRIIEEEKTEVSQKEIEEFVKSTGSDKDKITKEQQHMLKKVVARRKVLEMLIK